MRVLLSDRSQLDLSEIGDYIATDSPMRAVTFVRELQAACTKIGRMPTAYRLRPELLDGLRSATHKSYVIFFAVVDGDVLVARVMHGARDIDPSDFDPKEPGSST